MSTSADPQIRSPLFTIARGLRPASVKLVASHCIKSLSNVFGGRRFSIIISLKHISVSSTFYKLVYTVKVRTSVDRVLAIVFSNNAVFFWIILPCPFLITLNIRPTCRCIEVIRCRAWMQVQHGCRCCADTMQGDTLAGSYMPIFCLRSILIVQFTGSHAVMLDSSLLWFQQLNYGNYLQALLRMRLFTQCCLVPA